MNWFLLEWNIVNFENFPKIFPMYFPCTLLFPDIFSGEFDYLSTISIWGGSLGVKNIQVSNEIICKNNFTTLNEVYSILPKICLWSCSIVNKTRSIPFIFFTQKPFFTWNRYTFFDLILDIRKSAFQIPEVKIRQNKKKSHVQCDLVVIQIWRLGHQF